MNSLLSVRNLTVRFDTPAGTVHAVNDISYDVAEGETLGIVGESGSGKSVQMLSMLGLIPCPPGRIEAGEVFFEGRDLLKLSDAELRDLRGGRIGFIFQDPMTSLNPVLSVGRQIAEVLRRHKGMSWSAAWQRAGELLDLVGIPDPHKRLGQFPFQFSGGMRQRVMIAMAISCEPKLLIADEPTTALDVTVQKQVIKLLNDLQAKLGFAMIFVSHDLALVAEVASEITVMYAGQVIEQAPTKELLTNPIHEYTRGLLGSVLSIEEGTKDGTRLHQVPGSVPSPEDFPKGDRFAPRSSHPTIGLDVHPELKQLPNRADHKFSELPDDYLKENGITPYLETIAAAPAQEVE